MHAIKSADRVQARSYDRTPEFVLFPSAKQHDCLGTAMLGRRSAALRSYRPAGESNRLGHHLSHQPGRPCGVEANPPGKPFAYLEQAFRWCGRPSTNVPHPAGYRSNLYLSLHIGYGVAGNLHPIPDHLAPEPAAAGRKLLGTQARFAQAFRPVRGERAVRAAGD